MNCFAGCVITNLSNDSNSPNNFSSAVFVFNSFDGVKSNSGLSFVCLPFLNLSKIYSFYKLGSKNLIRLPNDCPIPQLWHLKNISFFFL